MKAVDARRHAPATARNREPLLAVLREVLPQAGRVLEVAAGTGEHAAFFAPAFPGLEWQPTDLDPDNLASIMAWRDAVGAPNLQAPMALDARASVWPVERADAVLNVNMIHIAPWSACVGLMCGAARVLTVGGVLVMYGPYAIGGAHTSPSNAAFDASLRARDASWGVRDLEVVRAVAADHGLRYERHVAMPANNLTVIYRRSAGAANQVTREPARGA